LAELPDWLSHENYSTPQQDLLKMEGSWKDINEETEPGLIDSATFIKIGMVISTEEQATGVESVITEVEEQMGKSQTKILRRKALLKRF